MIALIAAMSQDRVIAKNGKIPWHHSADLKFFRKTTMGSVVIMGRKTWESLPRKPLPGRINLVLSRDMAFLQSWIDYGIETSSSLEEALRRHQDAKVFIIGGGEVYRQSLPFADKIYLTVVPEFTINPDEAADYMLFPEINEDEWSMKKTENMINDLKLYEFVRN